MLLILIIFLFYTYKVYNETIRDLLIPGQPLAVREDPQRGVCVSGLTLHKVLFIFSNKHRVMYDIEDIVKWRCGDTKFLFECWKNISQVSATNEYIIHCGMCMIVSFIISLTIVTLVIDCEVCKYLARVSKMF